MGKPAKRQCEYPNPSHGTKAATEARLAVSKMGREERERLFKLGIAIANGEVTPQEISRTRREPAH